VLFPRKIQLDKPGMDTAITTKKIFCLDNLFPGTKPLGVLLSQGLSRGIRFRSIFPVGQTPFSLVSYSLALPRIGMLLPRGCLRNRKIYFSYWNAAKNQNITKMKEVFIFFTSEELVSWYKIHLKLLLSSLKNPLIPIIQHRLK